MQHSKEPHPDTPVFLTTAGAEARKVEPLAEALMKIIGLATDPERHTADDHIHVLLRQIELTAFNALIEVGL